MTTSTVTLRRIGYFAGYLDLAKPKSIIAHLITAAAGVVLAAGGRPQVDILVFTLGGGACLAAAANALNSYLDRDIDALMLRTSRRPLPSGRVAPDRALGLGAGLGAVGMLILGLWVNWLSAAIAVAALAYYGLYTLFLKRRSRWAAVAGSGAGALPPLIGWVAVTNRIEMTPLVLSLMIALWTLPHFWALAIYRREDFERAQLRVMHAKGVFGSIAGCSLLLTAASLLLWRVAHLGPIYLTVASLLGSGLLGLALTLRRGDKTAAARRLYGYSIAYIAVIFAAMIVDTIVL